MLCQLRKKKKMSIKEFELNEKMIIANKFKELRIKEGWTQTQIAEQVGVSFQTIQKYENGKITPNLEIIYKYSTLFSLKAGYFLGSVLPLNTGETSYADSKEDVRKSLREIEKKLDSYEPFEVPVYSQKTHNQKVSREEAYDFTYWSKNRVDGRENIFVLQSQMSCMYPQVNPNDRLVVDPNLPISEGLAIIQHGKVRKAFGTVGSSVVLIKKIDDKFYYVNNKLEGTQISQKPRLLKKNYYTGMVIQVNRSIQYNGSNQIHNDLPVSNEGVL